MADSGIFPHSLKWAGIEPLNGKVASSKGMAQNNTIVQPLRAAVIGTGKISEEHLRFLGTDPRVKLVGVCDLSPSLANYAVERFGAERAFSDSRQMLAEAKPDVVHVLTPPHTHYALVSDALKASAHVVVEKPVAPTHQEFLELIALADSCGKQIVEDHNYRFNEPVRAIEKLVRDGTLGDVREVDVRMALAIRKPGGRYMDASLPHPSHRMRPASFMNSSRICATLPCGSCRRMSGLGRPGASTATTPSSNTMTSTP